VPENTPPPPTSNRSSYSTRAQISTVELQDLADAVDELTQASIGSDLSFELRIELSGDELPSEDVVERLNKILQQISERLRLK